MHAYARTSIHGEEVDELYEDIRKALKENNHILFYYYLLIPGDFKVHIRKTTERRNMFGVRWYKEHGTKC